MTGARLLRVILVALVAAGIAASQATAQMIRYRCEANTECTNPAECSCGCFYSATCPNTLGFSSISWMRRPSVDPVFPTGVRWEYPVDYLPAGTTTVPFGQSVWKEMWMTAMTGWQAPGGYVPRDAVASSPTADSLRFVARNGTFQIQWVDRQTMENTYGDDYTDDMAETFPTLSSCPYIAGTNVIFITDPKLMINNVAYYPSWTSNPQEADIQTKIYFGYTASHEYGHCLGLNHHPEIPVDAVMQALSVSNMTRTFPRVCEHYFLKRGYKDAHPAVTITHFAATDSAGSRTVRWRAMHEEAGASYLLEHSSSWSGPFGLLQSIAGTGQPSYSVADAAPSGDIYRLREVTSGGDTILHVTDSTGVAIQMVSAAPSELPNADSLQVTQSIRDTRAYSSDAQPSSYVWACIVPEAWASAAQPLADFWSGRGTPAVVVTLESLGGPGGIKPWVEAQVPLGLKYLLLAGDANDYAMWTNTTIWDRGWSNPAWPTQEDKNIIPMSAYVVEDVDHKDLSMSIFTPYWASDWVYGDVDGDSLPEIAVGRVPALSAAQLTAFVQKTKNAANWTTSPYARTGGFWSYERTTTGSNGAYSAAWAESLHASLPSQLTWHSLYDSDAYPLGPGTREVLAKSALNEGRGLVILLSTGSYRYSWANWLDQTRAFGWGQLNHAPSALPFVLGTSCDIADIDMTEDPMVSTVAGPIPPLTQTTCFETDRGAWGVFGPTRGTWQAGNIRVAQEFLKAAYVSGAASAGDAARRAVHNTITKYPWLGDVARSYVFIGDPLVRIPGMKSATPSVWIEGPDSLANGASATYLARPSGGNEVFSYSWQARTSPTDPWQQVGTGISHEATAGSADLQLRVVVTSEGIAGSAIKCVQVSGSSASPIVVLSGPSAGCAGEEMTWTVSATQGKSCGVYLYRWRWRLASGTWTTPPANTSSSIVLTLPPSDVVIEAMVTGLTAKRETLIVDVDPVVVASLAAIGPSKTAAVITWTAPGGAECAATEYDLRYSQSAITAANFGDATRATTEVPLSGGSPECVVIDGLTQCTWYYFAIKTADVGGAWSGINCTASAKTKCSGGGSGVLCSGDGLMSSGSSDGDEWSVSQRVSENGVAVDGGHVVYLETSGSAAWARLWNGSSNVLRIAGLTLRSIALEAGDVTWSSGDSTYRGGARPPTSMTSVVNGKTVLIDLTGVGYMTSPGEVITPMFAEGVGGNVGVRVSGCNDWPADSSEIVIEWLRGEQWIVGESIRPTRGSRLVVIGGTDGNVRLRCIGEVLLEEVVAISDGVPERCIDRAPASALKRTPGVAPTVLGESDFALGSGESVTLKWDMPSDLGGMRCGNYLKFHVSEAVGVKAQREVTLEAKKGTPLSFALMAPEPNPSRASFKIPFRVAERALVRIEIIDLSGRLVRIVSNETLAAGDHMTTWRREDSRGVPVSAGIYFCRMSAARFMAQRKLIALP